MRYEAPPAPRRETPGQAQGRVYAEDLRRFYNRHGLRIPNQGYGNAYDYTQFASDWPVQGPTDPGMRAADGWWAYNILPSSPACVDCTGPIPAWARGAPGGCFTGVGERLSFGGKKVPGFALSAAGDPDIFARLSADQQTWVLATFNKLNALIVQSTGTTCPTWAPTIAAAPGCFQKWFNSSLPAAQFGQTKMLRTDGVFDEDTLCSLLAVAAAHPEDFLTAFPDPNKRYCQGPKPVVPTSFTATSTLPATTAPTTTAPSTTPAASPITPASDTGLSTGAKVGIGVVGVGAIGGIIYAATRSKKHKPHGRKSRRH